MVDPYAAKIKAAIDKLKPKSLAVEVSVIRRTTVYDPETLDTTVSEASTKATAIITSQTTTGPDGIKRVERVFMIPGASLKVAPIAGDTIRHKGRDYIVSHVDTKQPGGVPLAYFLVVED